MLGLVSGLSAQPTNEIIDLGNRFVISLRSEIVITYNFLADEDLPSISGITAEQLKSTKKTKVVRELIALDSGVRVYLAAYLLPNGYVKLIAKHGKAGGIIYMPPSNIISINTYAGKTSLIKRKTNEQDE